MEAEDAFLRDKAMSGCSSRTLKLYSYYLERYASSIPKPVDKSGLLEWLIQWPNPRTRHCVFRIVKTFIRWQARRGYCDNWVDGLEVRCQRAAPAPVLTIEDFEKIAAIMPATPQGARDRALYSCLFYTGARRDAVRLLKPDAVDTRERWMRIVTKGGKEQLLSLPQLAATRLADWLAIRPASEWVFPSLKHPGSAVAPDHVTRLLPLYAGAAGFTRRVYVHGLRHSHATVLIEAGVSIDIVQQQLGHADIKTTLGYTRQSPERLRKATDGVFR